MFFVFVQNVDMMLVSDISIHGFGAINELKLRLTPLNSVYLLGEKNDTEQLVQSQ